jgi:hypothetical protein
MVRVWGAQPPPPTHTHFSLTRAGPSPSRTRAHSCPRTLKHPPCCVPGPLSNATNLAVKGVASIAAYGYILEKYTGNASAAAEAYATAVAYSKVMVDYSWVNNGTDSHFMIGYRGSTKDGGETESWPCVGGVLAARTGAADTPFFQTCLTHTSSLLSHTRTALPLTRTCSMVRLRQQWSP